MTETTFQTLAIGQQAQAEAWVDDLLLGFGKEIDILPHASEPIRNLYGQSESEFDQPVSCTGRCILNPTKEQISIIGNEQKVDCALVFSRTELVRKFPSAEEGEWISELDQFSFEEKTYKITKVHPSGRIGDRATLVIVLGDTIAGRFRK